MKNVSPLAAALVVVLAACRTVPARQAADLRITTTALTLEAGSSRRVYALPVDTAGAPTADDVTWMSDSSGVAAVSGSGLITGRRAGQATINAQGGGRRASIAVTVTPARPDAIITVDPSDSLQAMRGWEVSAYAGQVECDTTSWRLIRDTIAARTVNESGINRIRLTVKSGTENPADNFTRFLSGADDFPQWRLHRYETVNDNDDPDTINPAGFTFSELDHTVQQIVLPMRRQLEARGESLYVTLILVAFAEPKFSFRQHPEEVGEFYLAVFQHLQATYGWVPDAAEILLEPDVADWTAEELGRALVAVTTRLNRAGFHPDIIAPSSTSIANALDYFRHIIAMPGVRPVVTDVSYHRYRGRNESAVAALGSLAALGGYRTMMLEHIGGDYRELHEDLTTGMSSAWQQFVIAACMGPDGGSLYLLDQHRPTAPRITLGRRTPFLIQYFRWVRQGAVRLQAWSNRGGLDGVAFRNRDGRTVVVVKADAAGQFRIEGLPRGRYGITYTTAAATLADAPDITIEAGAPLTTTIPGAGVITVHAR